MQYDQARELIRSGDVLAWSHRPLRTWHDLQIALVRIFTRSEWSHVGIAWAIGGRLFVLEAVSKAGVRIFPLSRAGCFTWVPRGQWSAVQEQIALAHIGQPYSKWDAIRAFFGLSDSSNGRWFCSEFVCAVLGIDLHKPTPAALMRHLAEHENLTGRFVSATP
jgi:hypothetical protein